MEIRKMKRPLLIACLLVLALVAIEIDGHFRREHGISNVMSQFREADLRFFSDSGSQPIGSGSALYVDDSMVAIVKTIKKVPFSVGARDTIIRLSGEWLSSPSPSMLNDTTLTVSVDEVPEPGSRMHGQLVSGLRGEFLGLVLLTDPRMALRLQLVRK